MAKGLTMNERATKLTVACGVTQRIMGDAFVARAQDDNRDLFKRLDMSRDEFAPNAAWVLRRRAENVERERNRGGGGGGSAASAAAAAAAAIQAAAAGAGARVVKKTKKKKKKKAEVQYVSTKAREEYQAKLAKWVDSKLAEWDADKDGFRASKQKSGVTTREEYDAFLRKKVEEKMGMVKVKEEE